MDGTLCAPKASSILYRHYTAASITLISFYNVLEIALKTYPENIDANRLYIQTMIQLAEKYPSYKEKAYNTDYELNLALSSLRS